MIRKGTAAAVATILQMDVPHERQIDKLKTAFAKEKKFCSDAVAVYGVTAEKCSNVPKKKYLYEDLLADVPDYHDEQDLREILSKYIALLILM